MNLVVHYLWHGLPLCGFSRELPARWPPGHLWISAADESTAVTCETCRLEFAKYPKGRRNG